MDKWIAVYFPSEEGNDPTKGGFNSEDEAWDYVKTFLCDGCKKALEDGCIECGTDDGEESFPIDHVSDTSCGCEWEVTTEEEWKELEKSDE